MKKIFLNFILIAGIALVSLSTAQLAKAATLTNFTDLGLIETNGTVSGETFLGGAVVNQISGSLASGTMAVFSYSFPNNAMAELVSGGLTVDTNYGLSGNTKVADYVGSATGFSGNVYSSPLVFVSAQIDASGKTATATIKNLSSGTLDFVNMLYGLINDYNVTGTLVSYEVSNVPVPAALPLFGLGFGAVAFGARKKRKTA